MCYGLLCSFIKINCSLSLKLFEIVSGSDTDDDFIPDLLGVDQATIDPNTGSQSSTGGQISQSPVPVPMNQDVLTPRSAGSSSMPLSGLPLMNTGTTGTPTVRPKKYGKRIISCNLRPDIIGLLISVFYVSLVIASRSVV